MKTLIILLLSGSMAFGSIPDEFLENDRKLTKTSFSKSVLDHFGNRCESDSYINVGSVPYKQRITRTIAEIPIKSFMRHQKEIKESIIQYIENIRGIQILNDVDLDIKDRIVYITISWG